MNYYPLQGIATVFYLAWTVTRTYFSRIQPLLDCHASFSFVVIGGLNSTHSWETLGKPGMKAVQLIGFSFAGRELR